MLQHTKAIVLRSVKYGDTSLISTLFTEKQGIQSYMVQGARSSKAKSNKAALLQPATLLDLVVYHKPQTKLQQIKEFQFAHIYTSLQEEVVKNSIALFSAELLLRLLPEQAQQPELFAFSFDYFCELDKMPVTDVANLPLYFIIHCSRILGYEIRGNYSADTPHLNLHEGAYMSLAPVAAPYVLDEDARVLNAFLLADDMASLKSIVLNAEMRYRLLDWYIEFLHQHTQHLSTIKSLEVLRAVLH
ncbi:MAG: DNA repair protein RecO [Bacteroidetes bacterium]|nr:DNA repair protein RecO [Bacteroidota bacterium]